MGIAAQTYVFSDHGVAQLGIEIKLSSSSGNLQPTVQSQTSQTSQKQFISPASHFPASCSLSSIIISEGTQVLVFSRTYFNLADEIFHIYT